jgi:hypothetical protein
MSEMWTGSLETGHRALIAVGVSVRELGIVQTDHDHLPAWVPSLGTIKATESSA